MPLVNIDGYDGFTLDVQVWSNIGKEYPDIIPQAHYLVHGIDDSLWTNSIDDVISYLKYELERIE